MPTINANLLPVYQSIPSSQASSDWLSSQNTWSQRRRTANEQSQVQFNQLALTIANAETQRNQAFGTYAVQYGQATNPVSAYANPTVLGQRLDIRV